MEWQENKVQCDVCTRVVLVYGANVEHWSKFEFQWKTRGYTDWHDEKLDVCAKCVGAGPKEFTVSRFKFWKRKSK